jgi:uroporphyrinogen-III synthase
MRLLVTRPEADAARTAARLRQLGHDAIVSPVLEVRPTGAPLPPGPFDALLLTSANALLAFPAGVPSDLACVPVLCVGERSAAAAGAAGFLAVTAAKGDGLALAELTRRKTRPGARLLYLAGTERKPDLEQALADLSLTVVGIYSAEPASGLTAPAEHALLVGSVDAVLHYSRRSAEAYLAICGARGLLPGALRPAQLCLSPDVAEAFGGQGRVDVHVASKPDEDALLGLLST